MDASEPPFAAKDRLRRWLEHKEPAQPQPPVLPESLPRGFRQIDDVILLLQPVRVVPVEDHEALLETLARLAEKNFLTGTEPLREGGIWAALVRGCAPAARGFHLELTENEGADAGQALLVARPASALVSTRPKAHVPLANFVERGGQFTAEAIGRLSTADVRVRWMGRTVLQAESLEALAR